MTILDNTAAHCPAELTKNMIHLHAQIGRKWLADLPALLLKAEERWQLTLGPCFPEASFNYVAPALFKDSSKAVLKCSIPKKAFHDEIAALNYFNGIGAVKLLQVEEEQGLMLLECIEPGTLLETEINQDKAMHCAVKLMQQLHRPLLNAATFPTLHELFNGFNDLYQRFDGKTGPFPRVLIDNAQAISLELLDSMGEPVLLHGDLHYANILLSDSKDAVAIDPKGFIGEREYETPFPRLTQDITKKMFRRQLDCFIEISGFDRPRVISWFFAKSMLAAWWSFEDSGEIWQPFLESAKRVLEIGI